MSACYSLIMMRLNKSRARSNSLGKSRSISTKGSIVKRSGSVVSGRAERNMVRVTIICGILVVLFVVCWLPYHVVNLAKIRGISVKGDVCKTIGSVTALLGYLNSALNPFVYNFIGTKFRKRLRSAMGIVRTSVSRDPLESGRKQDGRSSTGAVTTSSKINRRKFEIGLAAESSMPDSVFEDVKGETQKPLMTVAYDAKKDEVETIDIAYNQS